MSFTKKNEKIERLFESKSSDSEDNCQTDEEAVSEESIPGRLGLIENIPIKNQTALANKKIFSKNQKCRLTVSLRYGKCNRQLRNKTKSRKSPKQKKIVKTPEKSKNCSEKPNEISKKGKRCFLGGKAKSKPPEEESHDKNDSDDDSDNIYFGRISLGYFQKFKDTSGASTSYQWEEDDRNALSPAFVGEKLDNNTSEEMELLELQNWGKTALHSSYSRKTETVETVSDIKPDKL